MVEWRARGVVLDSDDEGSLSDGGTDAGASLRQNGESLFSSPEIASRATGETLSGCQRNLEGRASVGSQADQQEHPHDDEIYEDIENLSRQEGLDGHQASAASPSLPVGTKTYDVLLQDRDVFDIPSSGPDIRPRTPTHHVHIAGQLAHPLTPTDNGTINLARFAASQPQSTRQTPTHLASNLSSPLSEALSFASSPPRSPPPKAAPTTLVVAIPSAEDAPAFVPAYHRTFRQRAPIQLHPYLLEQEKYRESLRARGLRPVQIEEEERRRLEKSQHEESQSQGEAPESSQSRRDDHPVSSPPEQEGTMAQNRQDRYEDDDDLPSLEDLIRKRLDRGLQKGHKRQKTAHPRNLLASNDADTSPQLLGATGAALKKFRLPTIHGSSHLLTPGPSSDAEKQNASIIDVDSGSEPSTETPLPTRRSAAAPVGASVVRLSSPEISDASSDDEVVELRRATKRIKGVLPASWLRMDQQAQRHKPSALSRLTARSPPPTGLAPRGVAQRVRPLIRRYSPTSARFDNVINLEDESDEQPSANDTSTPRPSISDNVDNPTPRPSFKPVGETQDLEENDWVDPMLPSLTRRHHSRSRDKRQVRLKDAFGRAGDTMIAKPPKHQSHRGLPAQARQAKSGTKSRRSRDKYSIADAINPVARKTQPNFVRLALRTVEKQPDRGRHSPNRKQISFHEHQDAQKVERRLRDWQKGRLKVWQRPQDIAAPSKHSRRPLGEATGNQQARLPAPAKLSRTPSSHENNQNIRLSPPRSFTSISASRVRRKRQIRLDFQPTSHIELDRGHAESQSDGEIAKQAAVRKAGRRLKDVLFARPGQLEDLRPATFDRQRTDTFSNSLRDLDTTYDHNKQFNERTANPLLARYLSPQDHARHHNPTPLASSSTHNVRQARKRRKPIPRQIETAANTERHFPTEAQSTDRSNSNVDDVGLTLAGLGPYGTVYTTDFGVDHLPAGTYFHATTFVGSGELWDALHTRPRSVEDDNGHATINYLEHCWQWSAWNEDVACGFRMIFQSLQSEENDREAMADTTRTLVRFVAKTLYFSDQCDQAQFVERLHGILHDFLSAQLASSISSMPDNVHPSSPNSVAIRTYAVVLSFQIYRITQVGKLPSDVLEKTVRTIFLSVKLLTRSIASNVAQFGDLLHNVNKDAREGLVVRGDKSGIEALVVLKCLLHAAELPGLDLWAVMNEALLSRLPATLSHVDHFEAAWRAVFRLLPCLNFDYQGVYSCCTHTETATGPWSYIKVLLSRSLELYGDGTRGNGATMNAYLRAVFGRCLNLARKWKCDNAELVLGPMFDFFGRITFAGLSKEGGRSGSTFLDTLDKDPNLSAEPADRSFDLFLKLLATSLLASRARFTARKMKGITWRYIPNHGRRHDKEAELHEDDLDAIRNQHNLLSVLYWASASTTRISVSHLRNLVDVETSHSEVVRINIRSWTNLVRFQLCSQDDTAALDPFADWFNALLCSLIDLHSQARIEAEKTFSAAAAQTAGGMSRDLTEAVIATNERQVEGLITMLLAQMATLFDNASNTSFARHLFERSDLAKALALFNPSKPRLFQLVLLTLDTYKSYFGLCMDRHKALEAHSQHEDSQEFGDWSGIEALAVDPADVAESGRASEPAFKAVSKLLSDAFGAEAFYDDFLLAKTTDTWVSACQTQVALSVRAWAHFLDPYSSGSWSALRSSERSRAYGVYFHARILELDQSAYAEHKTTFIVAWMASLAERDSLLKHQHLLTNVLLKVDETNPLLQNLPIWRRQHDDSFSLTVVELQARRLSIISAVLANVRHAFETTDTHEDETYRLRQDYTSIVKAFMGEMKRVYQETQQASLRGAYVEFVQKAVEYLQQYTADIVPIDKFFTDSGAFPLPATDPTYVVGRLKGYASNLSDDRSWKKLAVFLQTVCERAATDIQQAYLVGQLSKSVDGIWESATPSRVSLRTMVLQALFPCYIDQVFSTECGWILAAPILEATTIMVERLHQDINMHDVKVTMYIMQLLEAVLRPMQSAVAHVARDTSLLSLPHVSSSLRRIFETATSMLPLTDFALRMNVKGNSTLSHLTYLHHFANILIRLSATEDYRSQLTTSQVLRPLPDPPTDHPAEPTRSSTFTDIVSFCKRELKESLDKNWSKHGSEYFFTRGRERREVVVDLATPEKELEDLIELAEGFIRLWRRMPGLRTLTDC